MLLKFKDGTIKSCSNPVEQKLFRGEVAVGWLCSVTISETTTSTEIDTLLTVNNISQLTFLGDTSEELFTLNGYSKLSSVIVRHSEKSSSVEIQISKGV